MLVLKRRAEQKIIIGDDITITVLHTGDGQVKLGIEAPRNLSVCRAELLDGGSVRTIGSHGKDLIKGEEA